MPLTATKKLIDSVAHSVDDNLIGFVKTHADLRLLRGHRVVVRTDVESLRSRGQVTIVSGGGSGHEPFAAGFVGRGMLSAAVAGSIFTSPPPNSVLAAIRTVAVENAGGTLLLVCNYTGDRLTFGQAVERAKLEGLRIEMMLVGEDTALVSPNKIVGRRGLCGMILIQKIAGAMAEAGYSLEEIMCTVDIATKRMGTIGVCLTPCSLPGSGPLFQMQSDEFELGLGIHGEAGIKKVKAQSASSIVEKMFVHMTNPDSGSSLQLHTGAHVALVVNNLGGLTTLELNIVAKAALNYLVEKKIHVMRCYTGTLQTSLEMSGVTLTVLIVSKDLLEYLDAETNAPAWQQCGKGIVNPESQLYLEPLPPPIFPPSQRSREQGVELKRAEADIFKKAIHHACTEIILSEAKLNLLDTGCGDGDCGTTLKTGAQVIQSELEVSIDVTRPMKAFTTIALLNAETMGGTSGGLYSIFFTAAARPLKEGTTPFDWCKSIEMGTKAIMQYGQADVGSRTMVDPLDAAHNMLHAQLEVGSRPVAALTEAVEAAKEATTMTANMKPTVGRASYVSSEHLVQPDAGATAVSIILQSILDIMKSPG